MQFDIETLTAPGFEFSSPERDTDAVIIISMSDNTGWEEVVSMDNMSEKELLERFAAAVRERDPDVLEGHNICRFDLPFLETRAKRHRVKLNLGRDGSGMRKRNSRFNAAERTINYTRYEIFGRHVIDTYHQTLFYDISHRNLESYGLKAVAKHFGVAAANRTYIDGNMITNAWQHDRKRLLAYALDDVRETRAISNIFSPSYFYQTQLIPMKYQDCVIRGNATCIDALLTAEYLSLGTALPEPEPPRAFAGGLTESFQAGVFKNVWHCDVRSLYPSIILAADWCPRQDTLRIFPRLLRALRQFRLEAKDAEKRAATPAEKDQFNALQTTFKILINSFYGYLGFNQGTFNDYSIAEQVTARGREILTMMLKTLNLAGANVLEMDTDGIYFQPPAQITDPAAMAKIVQLALPPGIEIELDNTYPAMFCYKSKNYALLEDDGTIALTGAALKSRGLEIFQREFIERFLAHLLRDEPEKISGLVREFRDAITQRSWPLEKLAKTETLSDSLASYQKKMAEGDSRRSAAYELAIASGRDYQRGDQVSFYMTGNKRKASVVDNAKLLADANPEQRDENIAYYSGKLEELIEKFAEFIPHQQGDGDLFSLQ
jgi:DNA polymerase elongation subunit (family B)